MLRCCLLSCVFFSLLFYLRGSWLILARLHAHTDEEHGLKRRHSTSTFVCINKNQCVWVCLCCCLFVKSIAFLALIFSLPRTGTGYRFCFTYIYLVASIDTVLLMLAVAIACVFTCMVRLYLCINYICISLNVIRCCCCCFIELNWMLCLWLLTVRCVVWIDIQTDANMNVMNEMDSFIPVDLGKVNQTRAVQFSSAMLQFGRCFW